MYSGRINHNQTSLLSYRSLLLPTKIRSHNTIQICNKNSTHLSPVSCTAKINKLREYTYNHEMRHMSWPTYFLPKYEKRVDLLSNPVFRFPFFLIFELLLILLSSLTPISDSDEKPSRSRFIRHVDAVGEQFARLSSDLLSRMEQEEAT